MALPDSRHIASMTFVAGVDGCPAGWIATALADRRFARAEIAQIKCFHCPLK